MTLTTMVLAALAVTRLARLVTVDELSAPFRRWVGARGEGWAYFITCPWCTSIWLGAVVAPFVVLWPGNRLLLAVLFIPAVSLVAGWSATLEDRVDR